MFYRPIAPTVRAAIAMGALLALPVAVKAQSNAPASSAATQQPPTRAQVSAQLDTNFKAIDTNGDKSLNAAEIEAAQARSIAQAKATIAQRLEAEFTRMDGNKDGQLSLAEFKTAAPEPKAAPASELLGQIDRNKDGKVSQEEYRATPLANFDRLDTNKDGTISAQEQSAAKSK